MGEKGEEGYKCSQSQQAQDKLVLVECHNSGYCATGHTWGRHQDTRVATDGRKGGAASLL